jgi:hypothetical protein
MIIFRVAQGIAWTSQTTVSDLTIHGMPVNGRLEHRSIIRFQAVSGEHPVTSQPRNQLPLDELRDVLDAELNSHGVFPTNSAEKVGPNAN